MLAFKAIPKYRDNVYDPDPEKSYTKAKLQRKFLFPTDEVANEVFNNNFSVLPNFVPIQNLESNSWRFKSATTPAKSSF